MPGNTASKAPGKPTVGVHLYSDQLRRGVRLLDPTPPPSRCRGERIADGAEALVLSDPAFRRGFGGEARGGLRQRPDPDDFNGKAVVFAMNDPIRRVCH